MRWTPLRATLIAITVACSPSLRAQTSPADAPAEPVPAPAPVPPVAPTAAAATWRGALRLTAGAGGDSNAARTFGASTPDGVLSLLASAEGQYRRGALQLWGDYDLGVRKFLVYPSEDTLVQAAQLHGAWAPRPWLRLGLDVGAKDRRGAERSYTDLRGAPFVEFSPDAQLEVRLAAGPRRFWYHPVYLHTFSAVETQAQLRYRFDRRHSGLLFLDWSQRWYEGNARPPPPTPDAELGRRRDQLLGAGLGYAYRGPLFGQLTYSFEDHGSNSFGERLARHRLAASAGMRLPWEVVLLAQLTVQLTNYPDGVYLSPLTRLEEDDETHNALSLKLSRPITERLDVELRASAYQNAFGGDVLEYLRVVAWTGVTFRL